MLRNRASLRHHGYQLIAQMVHGSAVAIGGNGVLLLGPSGSGKSDLALRLIDRGAQLVSDDIVHIESNLDSLVLKLAPSIAGKIEVRGIGICPVPHVDSAALRLVVEFAKEVERMPPEDVRILIGSFLVPLVRLDPFQASSALKVEMALRSVIDAALMPVAGSKSTATESIGN